MNYNQPLVILTNKYQKTFLIWLIPTNSFQKIMLISFFLVVLK